MDPFDDVSAARDSDAEAAWYRSGLSSGVRTASGESVSGLQETADSSWDVVPAPDSSAPRRVDRAVAAAYQSLDGAMAKQVWEDDFWGRLFSSDSHDPFKGFYGTDHKRPLQPDVPATGEEPAAVKRRQAGMASLRFFEMSVEETRGHLETAAGGSTRRGIGLLGRLYFQVGEWSAGERPAVQSAFGGR